MAIIEIDKDKEEELKKNPDYVKPINTLPDAFKELGQSNALYFEWYNRVQQTRKSIKTLAKLGTTTVGVPLFEDEVIAEVVSKLTYPQISAFKNIDGSPMIIEAAWKDILVGIIKSIKAGKESDEETQKKLQDILGDVALGIAAQNLVMIIMDKLGNLLLLLDEITALIASIISFITGAPVKYTSLTAAVQSAALALPVATSGGAGTANATGFNTALQTLQAADRTATPENLKAMIVSLGDKLLNAITLMVETKCDKVLTTVGGTVDTFNTLVTAFNGFYTALKVLTGI